MANITIVNFNKSVQSWLPLGALSVATSLKQHNHKIKFIDIQTQVKKLSKKELVKKLDTKSKYLAIGTNSMMLPWLFPVLKEIKKKDKNKIIILGGPGVSNIGKYLLKKYSEINYIIVGEAESAIVALLKALTNSPTNLNEIPNLIWRKNKTIKENNKKREKINNIEKIDLNIVNLDNYNTNTNFINNRGCYHDCSFCYKKNVWGNEIQPLTIKNLFQQIDYLLKKTKKDYIYFVDDLFILTKSRMNKFKEVYLKNKYSFSYYILGAHIQDINLEILKILKETNCKGISFGFESGSDNILKKINKTFTIKQAVQKAIMTKKFIPVVTISFIIGFPFETTTDVQKTTIAIKKLHEHNIQILYSFLRPQNGTAIYKKYHQTLEFMDHKYLLSPQKITNKIKNIIKEDPIIHAWFYTYKTPNFKEKMKIYKKTIKLIR